MTPPDDAAAAAGVFDWFVKWGAAVVAAILAGFGGIVLAAWNAGSRLTSLDAAQRRNAEDIAALRDQVAAVTRDHSALAVAVAALPTRADMTAAFEALRSEIRALDRVHPPRE